jgi:hypothetical protein
MKVVRAIGQAGSHWLPTAAVLFRSQVKSSRIYDGQSGTEAGFLRVLRFPLPILIPHTYILSGAGKIGQLVVDVRNGPSLTKPHETNKKIDIVIQT